MLLAVLAQAWVSWPIRAGCVFRRGILKETVAKTECAAALDEKTDVFLSIEACKLMLTQIKVINSAQYSSVLTWDPSAALSGRIHSGCCEVPTSLCAVASEAEQDSASAPPPDAAAPPPASAAPPPSPSAWTQKTELSQSTSKEYLLSLKLLRKTQSTSPVSPLDLLLGRPVVQNQFVVALLQLSGRHVQLLVHFSVLVIDLPEEVHLLRQVLEERHRRCSWKGWGPGNGKQFPSTLLSRRMLRHIHKIKAKPLCEEMIWCNFSPSDTWTSPRAPSAAPYSESFFKDRLSYQPLQSGHFEPFHNLISRLRKLHRDNRPAVRSTVQCRTFTGSLAKWSKKQRIP